MAVADLYELLITKISKESKADLIFPFLKIYASQTEKTLSYEVKLRPLTNSHLRSSVRLWLGSAEDERTYPQLKGPDYEYLTKLRLKAQEAGYDEAILYKGEQVAEAGFGSLVIVKGKKLVFNLNPNRLTSITELALAELAKRQKWEIEYEYFTLKSLDQAPCLWVLSSLHTVQSVTSINGRNIKPAAGFSASEVKQLLWEMSGEIGELAA